VNRRLSSLAAMVIERGCGASRSAVPTPVMTHVCKRGGRPPSAFRLLPCGNRRELAHQRVVIESDSLF